MTTEGPLFVSLFGVALTYNCKRDFYLELIELTKGVHRLRVNLEFKINGIIYNTDKNLYVWLLT